MSSKSEISQNYSRKNTQILVKNSRKRKDFRVKRNAKIHTERAISKPKILPAIPTKPLILPAQMPQKIRPFRNPTPASPPDCQRRIRPALHRLHRQNPHRHVREASRNRIRNAGCLRRRPKQTKEIRPTFLQEISSFLSNNN